MEIKEISGRYQDHCEGSRSYLSYEMPEASESADEWRMIMDNEISGFMICAARWMDGRQYILFDRTLRQRMDTCYENREMTYDELVKLLLSLNQCMDSVQEYLLNADALQLDAGKMYLGIEVSDLAVIYNPEEKRPFHDRIRGVAEYILNIIDHKDDRAVILAYQFYKYAASENFHMGEFLLQNRQSLHQPETGAEAVADRELENKNIAPEQLRSSMEKEVSADREQTYAEDYDLVCHESYDRSIMIRKSILMVMFAVFSFAVLVVLVLIYAPYNIGLILPVLVLGYILFAGWWYLNERKRKKQEEAERELYYQNRRTLEQ